MTQWSNIVLAVAVGLVALTVVLGVVNMMRGGDPARSQILMRWRVGLQFVAILIIFAILYSRS